MTTPRSTGGREDGGDVGDGGDDGDDGDDGDIGDVGDGETLTGDGSGHSGIDQE